MIQTLSQLYSSLLTFFVATTVGSAEPKALDLDFGHIQPGLEFGTPCKTAARTLDRLGLTYLQQEEYNWIIITGDQILGHPLKQANEPLSSSRETSKIWCSHASGIYRVDLIWAASPTGSLYTNLIETLTQKLQSPPNSKKVRRRGARACATWPANKSKATRNTIQVCQGRAFTKLNATSPKLEKAARAANAMKKLNELPGP